MRKRNFVAAVVLMGSALPSAWGLDLDASLEWARRVELSTPVSGTVVEVNVAPGEAVKKDQVLLRLDQRGFKAAVQRAQARLDGLKEARAEAQRELERAEELYDRTVLSEHELQMAKIGYATADAEYRAAQANLTQARLDLEYSVLRAPFAGIVVRRQAEVGQTVVTELRPEPLLTLAEAGRMTARAHVAHGNLAGLSIGQRATVTVAGRDYPGTVRHIGLEPVADRAGPSYLIEVEVQPGRDVLRAGLPARVSLP